MYGWTVTIVPVSREVNEMAIACPVDLDTRKLVAAFAEAGFADVRITRTVPVNMINPTVLTGVWHNW